MELSKIIQYAGKHLQKGRRWTSVGQLQRYILGFSETKTVPPAEEVQEALDILVVGFFLNEHEDPKLGKIYTRYLPKGCKCDEDNKYTKDDK